MLQLRNPTGLAGLLFASPDVNGVDTLYTIVKGTFDLRRSLALADEQVPVIPAAKHYDDPATTSIRVPGDVTLEKLATDVLVIGTAYAPDGKRTWQMDVSVRVGPVSKTLRVSADRRWDRSASGYTAAWVAPFERMPLTWERAFGGTQKTATGSVAELRNPVGVGFHVPEGDGTPLGTPLPNVEDPRVPLTSTEDRPPPAGCAPIAAHWEPRRSYAGTYDEAWQQRRAPYLPTDFDARFLQLAPPGLVTPGYLHGGEPVELRGLTASGTLSFTLPRARISTTYVFDSVRETRTANLDTVLIEPDAGRLVLVWRSGLTCDKKLLKVREVVIGAEAGAIL